MAEQSSGAIYNRKNDVMSQQKVTSKPNEPPKSLEVMDQILLNLKTPCGYEEKMMKIINGWEKFLVVAHNFDDINSISSQLFRRTLVHILDLKYESLKAVIRTHLLMTLRRCANSLLHLPNKDVSKRCMEMVHLCSPPGPWSNHGIDEILNGSDAIDDDVVMKYCTSETMEIIKVRVQSLLQAGKLEMALRLCSVCVRHEPLRQDLFFVDTQLILMQRLGQVSDIAKTVQSWSCNDGVNIIQRMLKNGIKNGVADKVSLAQCLCNIFLLQDVLNCDNDCCTKKLMQLWCMIHVYLSTDADILAEQVKKIFYKLQDATSSAHFYLFVDVLYKEFGQSIRPLCIELYIRALTVDLNLLEAATHKDNIKAETEIKVHLADVFTRMVDLVKDNDLVSRECLLTAYSLEPTSDRINKLEVIALTHQVRCLMVNGDKVMERKTVPRECHCGRDSRCSSPLNEEKDVEVPFSDKAFSAESSNYYGCLVPTELLHVEIEGVSTQTLQDLIMVLERPRSWQLKWTIDWSIMKKRCLEYEHKVLNSTRITQVPSYNEQLNMYLNTVQVKPDVDSEAYMPDESDISCSETETSSEVADFASSDSDFSSSKYRSRRARKKQPSSQIRSNSLYEVNQNWPVKSSHIPYNSATVKLNPWQIESLQRKAEDRMLTDVSKPNVPPVDAAQSPLPNPSLSRSSEAHGHHVNTTAIDALSKTGQMVTKADSLSSATVMRQANEAISQSVSKEGVIKPIQIPNSNAGSMPNTSNVGKLINGKPIVPIVSTVKLPISTKAKKLPIKMKKPPAKTKKPAVRVQKAPPVCLKNLATKEFGPLPKGVQKKKHVLGMIDENGKIVLVEKYILVSAPEVTKPPVAAKPIPSTPKLPTTVTKAQTDKSKPAPVVAKNEGLASSMTDIVKKHIEIQKEAMLKEQEMKKGFHSKTRSRNRPIKPNVILPKAPSHTKTVLQSQVKPIRPKTKLVSETEVSGANLNGVTAAKAIVSNSNFSSFENLLNDFENQCAPKPQPKADEGLTLPSFNEMFSKRTPASPSCSVASSPSSLTVPVTNAVLNSLLPTPVMRQQPSSQNLSISVPNVVSIATPTHINIVSLPPEPSPVTTNQLTIMPDTLIDSFGNFIQQSPVVDQVILPDTQPIVFTPSQPIMTEQVIIPNLVPEITSQPNVITQPLFPEPLSNQQLISSLPVTVSPSHQFLQTVEVCQPHFIPENNFVTTVHYAAEGIQPTTVESQTIVDVVHQTGIDRAAAVPLTPQVDVVEPNVVFYSPSENEPNKQEPDVAVHNCTNVDDCADERNCDDFQMASGDEFVQPDESHQGQLIEDHSAENDAGSSENDVEEANVEGQVENQAFVSDDKREVAESDGKSRFAANSNHAVTENPLIIVPDVMDASENSCNSEQSNDKTDSSSAEMPDGRRDCYDEQIEDRPIASTVPAPAENSDSESNLVCDRIEEQPFVGHDIGKASAGVTPDEASQQAMDQRQESKPSEIENAEEQPFVGNDVGETSQGAKPNKANQQAMDKRRESKPAEIESAEEDGENRSTIKDDIIQTFGNEMEEPQTTTKGLLPGDNQPETSALKTCRRQSSPIPAIKSEDVVMSTDMVNQSPVQKFSSNVADETQTTTNNGLPQGELKNDEHCESRGSSALDDLKSEESSSNDDSPSSSVMDLITSSPMADDSSSSALDDYTEHSCETFDSCGSNNRTSLQNSVARLPTIDECRFTSLMTQASNGNSTNSVEGGMKSCDSSSTGSGKYSEVSSTETKDSSATTSLENGTKSKFRWFGLRKQYSDIKFGRARPNKNTFLSCKDSERKKEMKEEKPNEILNLETVLKLKERLKESSIAVIKLPKSVIATADLKQLQSEICHAKNSDGTSSHKTEVYSVPKVILSKITLPVPAETAVVPKNAIVPAETAVVPKNAIVPSSNGFSILKDELMKDLTEPMTGSDVEIKDAPTTELNGDESTSETANETSPKCLNKTEEGVKRGRGRPRGTFKVKRNQNKENKAKMAESLKESGPKTRFYHKRRASHIDDKSSPKKTRTMEIKSDVLVPTRRSCRLRKAKVYD